MEEVKLAADFPRTGHGNAAAQKIVFHKDMAANLIHISKSNDLSLYVLLLSTIKLLLFKLTDKNDILITSPTLAKSNQDFNKFVPFRDFLHPDMSFRDLLMKVKQTVAQGYQHQYYPVRRLNRILNLENGYSLYRVVLLLENIHKKESCQFSWSKILGRII